MVPDPSARGRKSKVVPIRLSAIAVALTMIVCCFAFVDYSDFSDAATSGTCGTDLNWNYNTTTKALTITGTGTEMADYTILDERWGGYTSDIKTVSMPSSLEHIGNMAFASCSNIDSISFPGNLVSVGNYAFSGCNHLGSVTMNNGLQSIGTFAFSNCTSLNGITIPSTVNTINSDAFDGCSSLESITVPESVTSFGTSVFNDCSDLSSASIDANIATVPNSTFAGCASLTSVTLSESIETIDDYAFHNCSSLSTFAIPLGVTSIGTGAFTGCTSLTTVSTLCTNPLGLTKGSSDNGGVALNATDIILIHDYTAVENWADDGRSCDLTLVCVNDPSHKVVADLHIKASVMIAPTESTKGSTNYSYNYVHEGIPYNGNKIVEDIDCLASGEFWTDFSGAVISESVATDITDALDMAKALGLSTKIIATTSIGDVVMTFDPDAVDSMTYAAATMNLNFVGGLSDIAGEGMTVNVTLGSTSMTAGKVKISMPLNAVVPSGGSIKVYSAADNSDLNATYQNGTLSFSSNALCNFKIVYENGTTPGGDDVDPTPGGGGSEGSDGNNNGGSEGSGGNNNGGSGFPVWIVTLIIGCALGFGLAFLIRYIDAQKKKSE